MIQSISKDKLPKDYGYVLQSSYFESVLKENGIGTHTDLIYTFSNQSVVYIFEVFYWMPNANIPHERLYVRAGAVSKMNIRPARNELAKTVIPRFLDWIIPILNAPTDSPIKQYNKSFCANYSDGVLSIQQ